MSGGRREGGREEREGGAVRGGREGFFSWEELNKACTFPHTFAGLPRVSLLERELNTD